MGLDASIYQNVGRFKSMRDYDNEEAASKLNALQLASAQSQYDQGQEGIRRDNALRGLSLTGNEDTDYNALRQIDPKAADAYRKSALEAKEKKSKIAHQDAQTTEIGANMDSKKLADKIKASEFHIQQLGPLQTMEDIAAWNAEGVRTGVLDPERSATGLKMFADYAAKNGFEAAKQQALRGGMSATEQLKAAHQEAVLKETGRSNLAREGLTASGQAETARAHRASEGLTARGQNMTDARARELQGDSKELAAQAKKDATVDKEVTKFSGTLQKEGIPELEGAVAGAEGALGRYKPGEVPGVGALKNILPAAMMSSEGKDVRQALAQVRNIVLSARSGAAVTDQELRRLVEEIGTGAGMSEEDLRRGLSRVRERIDLIKTNAAAGVSDDVLSTYKGRGGIDIKRGGAKPDAAAAFADADKEARYQAWKRKQ